MRARRANTGPLENEVPSPLALLLLLLLTAYARVCLASVDTRGLVSVPRPGRACLGNFCPMNDAFIFSLDSGIVVSYNWLF